MPAFQKKFVDELLPLEQTSTALRIRLLNQLDDAYLQKGLSKAEQHTLSGMIASMARDLLDFSDDAQLKAIHARHAPPITAATQQPSRCRSRSRNRRLA